MRDAVGSYLPLGARHGAATPMWTWFTRVALWAGIGLLVAVFAIATDPVKVGVVAGVSAIAAPAWRQLSWALRSIISLGLVWLSIAEFGIGLGLGLDALVICWWWLPAQLSVGVQAPAPEPEEDLASLVTPAGALRPYELPVSGKPPGEPAPLRRGAAPAGGRDHHARQHPLPRRAAENDRTLAPHLQRHPPQPLAGQGRRLASTEVTVGRS
jgi:hypothetical protein